MHSENLSQNVYSKRINAGPRRTYYIDVKMTKSQEFYLVITENTLVNNSEKPIRQRLMIYPENFNVFQNALNEAITKVKTDLDPNFNYDVYSS
jgi:hypothetical protein